MKNLSGHLERALESTSQKNPPFYGSFDIRDAGFKIAPVDANLFPAGWNNLSESDRLHMPKLFHDWINRNCGEKVRKILLISENHTMNTFYFENLRVLKVLLRDAGFDVIAGFRGHPLWTTTQSITTFTGQKVTVHPVTMRNGIPHVSPAWIPDVVVMNHDGTAGYGDEWNDVKVPVVPPISMGWHRRRKSWFFDEWNKHVSALGRTYSFDPWLLSVETKHVGAIDFRSDDGLGDVARAVDEILEHTADHYRKYSIHSRPSAFIKHASGTYGMGVMSVESGSEILHPNRKTRNKMSVGKGKQVVTEVVVQEALPTSMRTGVADEPVMYTIGNHCVGGFLRTNSQRGPTENLNSTGMTFHSLDSITSDLKQLYALVARHCTVVLGQELKTYASTKEVTASPSDR